MSARPQGTPRHSHEPARGLGSLLLRFLAVALAVLMVSGASVGAIALAQLAGNIETVALPGEEGGPAAPPALGPYEGEFNILIVGSDRCEVEGGCPDREAELNDVTMLLHVYADHKTAVAVSIPRDLIVPVPACPKADGSGEHAAMTAQPINVTLGYGGLACTVLTVEALSGLDIPYAGLITFNGVIEMSNAVGGVPVCVDGPIRDPYSGLNLPEAGEYTLSGGEALAFLRSRHGVGDGSDIGRISSQQVYLSSLVRTVKSNDTLTNVAKLFGIAQAATSNMTLSNSMANLNTLVSMALVIKDIPLETITFVQYPGTTGEPGIYFNKVKPLEKEADALFSALKSDRPFTLAEGTGLGAGLDPNAPGGIPSESPSVSASPDPSASSSVAPTPEVEVLQGITGQTAAEYTCSKANN